MLSNMTHYTLPEKKIERKQRKTRQKSQNLSQICLPSSYISGKSVSVDYIRNLLSLILQFLENIFKTIVMSTISQCVLILFNLL